jgi:hypothetical protein
MSEQAHTPGPYTSAYDNRDGGRIITAVVRGEEVRVGMTTRVVFGVKEYVSEGQAKANANLFAAAPAFLDALEKLRTELSPDTNPDPADAANFAAIIVRNALEEYGR